MKIKSFLFVSAVLLVAVTCIGIMNIHYDRLSRYPYEDEEARAIINEYFSDKDIEYLIEYSIAPSTFIRYVPYDGFSVYHSDDYNCIRDKVWYLSDEEVVEVVELGRSQMTMYELSSRLLNYDLMTVVRYLKQEDIYAEGSILIDNPTALNAYVDNEATVSSRILFDTETLTMIPSLTEEPVQMSEIVVEPLTSLCSAISSELGNKKACGGLIADAGYVSYDAQKVIYEEAVQLYGKDVLFHADLPGHSEHQLGTAIDFSVEGVSQEEFRKTEQYQWLKENAHRFGFVQSYTEVNSEITMKNARSWHWRYVGNDYAAEIYFNSLSLKEISSWGK